MFGEKGDEEDEGYSGDWVDTSGDDMYYGVKIFDEIVSPNQQKVGGIYLGRVHFLNRKQQMKDLGIGAVLSVIDTKVEFSKEDKLKHLYIKVEDWSDQDLRSSFEKTNDFLEENLKTTNVFVHCQMGISRSSTIVIAYLMKKRQQRFEEVLKEVVEKRNCVCPNPGFQFQLRAYEKTLFKE